MSAGRDEGLDESRRRLLACALAGGVAALTGYSSQGRELIERIRELLYSVERESADAVLARRVVFGDASQPLASSRCSHAEIRRRIIANIECDYRDGRTVLEGSWILARTEADALKLMRRLYLT